MHLNKKARKKARKALLYLVLLRLLYPPKPQPRKAGGDAGHGKA